MGSVTAIRSVPILASRGAPTAVELHDALPIEAFLAPAADAKGAFSAAFEALVPGAPSQAQVRCAEPGSTQVYQGDLERLCRV